MSVHLWEETVTIPTYPVGKANPHPPFDREGNRDVYPYPLLDTLSDHAEPREYRALFLENPYLRVMVLPEIGGRVWSLYDKIAERECLYRPPSIKPALIGLTGAWIAGGIEFNFPIGHRYTTHQSVLYTLAYPQEQGEKGTIWLGEICRRSRMMWMVGISLYPDRALMETDIRLFNRTELKKRFYFWTNCAVPAHEHWKWLLPTRSVRNWEGDLSEPRATLPFPITDDGTDLSLYRSYDSASSVFAHDFRGDFFGGYDLQADAGLLHVADWRDVRGRKLFTWGAADDGMVWAERLNDDGIPYVEIQTGRFEDQSIWHWIPPHTLECWQEAWYPIREMAGVVSSANREGALGVTLEEQQMTVRLHATTPRPDHRLLIQYGDSMIHEQRVDLYPERPGKWQFTLPQQPELPLKVVIATNSREPVLEAIANPPAEREQVLITLPRRESPLGDEQFVQADACERAGRLEEALQKYRESAQRGSIPAVNAITRHLLETGCLQECLQVTETTLQRDPQNWEAMYLHALCLITLDRAEEAEEYLYLLRRSAEYRGLAYYLLGICAMRRGELARANDLFAEALLYNAADIKAWMMRAVVLRLRGELEEASQVRLQVHLLTPLEPLLRTEAFFSAPSTSEGDAVNLLRPLSVQPHLFEEVACDYLNAGCLNDAIRILEAPTHLQLPETALRHYLLALAYVRKGLPAQAVEHSLLAERSDTEYLFPWRLEDGLALQEVLKLRPDDALARYALGNWLMAHRRQTEALLEWLRVLDAEKVDEALAKGEVSAEQPLTGRTRRAWRQLAESVLKAEPPPDMPQLVGLYRNIGLALSRIINIPTTGARFYEKAIALCPNDPVLWVERETIALSPQATGAGTIQRLYSAPQEVRQDNRVAQVLVDALMSQEYFIQAIELLRSCTFHVAEGDTHIRRQWYWAHTMQGIGKAQFGVWDEALEYFLTAMEYPRNLGVGKPARPPHVVALFWAGLMAFQLRMRKEAFRYWEECVNCPAETKDEYAYQIAALQFLARHKEAKSLLKQSGAHMELQALESDLMYLQEIGGILP